MTKARSASDVDVSRYAAKTAARLHDRLTNVSSVIRRSLEDQIPELRADPSVMELPGTSIEGNVDTRIIDVDAATTSIRYPLRWHHLGLVMWDPDVGTEGDELAQLQRFLRELGEAAGAGATLLFVAADRTCGWGWLPYRAAVADATRSRPTEPVRSMQNTRNDGWRRGPT